MYRISYVYNVFGAPRDALSLYDCRNRLLIQGCQGLNQTTGVLSAACNIMEIPYFIGDPPNRIT